MATKSPLAELLDPEVTSGGLSALLAVPDPAGSLASNDNIECVAGQLFGLLGAVVHRDAHLIQDDDRGADDPDSPEWAEAFRKLVAFATWLLKDERFREKFLSDAIDKPSALSFTHFVGSPEAPGLADSVKVERTLLFGFFLALTMSRTAALAAGPVSSVFPLRPGHTALELISSLASLAASSRGDAHSDAAAAMVDCLLLAARHYGRAGDEKERKRLEDTANSVLQVHELPLLAGRWPAMLQKYGERAVELRFEQQLSLALQTFGFRTVPALRGERRGDILCLTDKTPATAILVEAKTSARPYTLPTRDQRALAEYAHQIGAASWFQHPLKLVCVIGPEPSGSIAERLAGLESRIEVSVRYCSASALIGLLARPPIGVTTEDIVEALIAADPVVPKDRLSSLSSKAEDKLAEVRRSIRSFLR